MDEKPVEVCSQCGTPNVTRSAWCEKCLAPFKDYGREMVLTCPECRHENSYAEDYCEVCHEPLKPGQWE